MIISLHGPRTCPVLRHFQSKCKDQQSVEDPPTARYEKENIALRRMFDAPIGPYVVHCYSVDRHSFVLILSGMIDRVVKTWGRRTEVRKNPVLNTHLTSSSAMVKPGGYTRLPKRRKGKKKRQNDADVFPLFFFLFHRHICECTTCTSLKIPPGTLR